MRFKYVDRSGRLICSSKLTTICLIAKSTSTFYTGMLHDHPLMPVVLHLDEIEVQYETDMLVIITSLVLL